jgi:hypothetical protein
LAQPGPTPRPATVHRPSDARSAKEALTDEARAALSNWNDELDEFDEFDEFAELRGFDEDGKEVTEKVRTPNPSTFLTSPPPAKPAKPGKPGKRKRQDTGDWLC